VHELQVTTLKQEQLAQGVERKRDPTAVRADNRLFRNVDIERCLVHAEAHVLPFQDDRNEAVVV